MLKVSKYLFISLLLIDLSRPVYSQPESTREKSFQDQSQEALPAFLVKTTFQVRDRLVVNFDGSEAAGGILKTSESWNRLLYLDPANWRVLREYPIIHSSREVLSLDSHQYIISSRNRKIESPKSLPDAIWMEVLLSPYRMAKELGFNLDADSYAEWLQKVQNLETDLENDNAGKLSVEKKETDQGKILRLVLEGYYTHEGKTRARVLEEWSLEYDIRATKKELEKSLIGGSS